MVRSRNGVLKQRLTLRSKTTVVGDQEVSDMMLINGEYPGPTLQIHPGDRLELEIVNRLDDPANVHFHGLHVSPKGIADNVLREMEPGSTNSVVVKIPEDHPTGLDWYHAHQHGYAQDQVYRGVSGMFLVQAKRDRKHSGAEYARERLFALQTLWAVDGEVVSPEDSTLQFTSAPTHINGMTNPTISIRPGQRQLWGLANMDGRAYQLLELEGHTFKVIGEDGQPYEEPEKMDTLLMPPGRRYEVPVKGGSKGDYTLRRLPFTISPTNTFLPQDLATVEVAGKARKGRRRTLPPRHGTFEDLSDADVDVERTMRLSSKTVDDVEQFFINGMQFDHTRLDVRSKLGTVEEWTFINESSVDHPMHIHTNHMQVMSVNGQAVEPHATDTVNVPEAPNPNAEVYSEAVIRFSPRDFTGTAVFHCHILNHEDYGMMGTIKYVK